MKGSTKIKITLIILAVFLAITTLPKYIMMLPWDNAKFINGIIFLLIINEIFSTITAMSSAEFDRQWDNDWWYKWFSVTAWIVVGIKLLWKHGMKLSDKYLTD